MKAVRFIRSFAAVIVTLAAVCWLAPYAGSTEAGRPLYTCSMHPQILLDHPGDCPICGMKLVPVHGNAPGGQRRIRFYQSSMNPGEISDKPGKDSMGMDLVPVYEDKSDDATDIVIDSGTIQKMNLKTDVVRTGPVRREIRAVGTVVFNEESLQDITTKYEGWIEKLFINTTWARVQAGDPLFEIYSPDLFNAQLNYLIALRSEGTEGGPLTTPRRNACGSSTCRTNSSPPWRAAARRSGPMFSMRPPPAWSWRRPPCRA